MTATETSIVELLLRRSPSVLTRRLIATQVWDDEADAVGSNTIDVHVGPGARQAGSQPGSDRDRTRHRIPDGRDVNVSRAHRRHALRVAAMATLVVMVCYVIAAVILNLVVTRHLVGTSDARLRDHSHDTSHQTLSLPAPNAQGEQTDVDDAPVFLWSIAPSGAVTAPDADRTPAPRPTLGQHRPRHLPVGTSTFRFDALRTNGTVLVAGQSIAETRNVQSTLLVAELVFGLILAVAVFGGATVVGLRASAPSELVRRRQAEFTADASHELRTPISVIEAEVSLALDRPRDPAAYREVLERVGSRGQAPAPDRRGPALAGPSRQ